MEIGLYLPDAVYDKGIPVFIRQKSSGALLSLLNNEHIDPPVENKSGKEPYRKYGRVYPFGMLEDCYDLERKDIKIAKRVNVVYLGKEQKESENEWKKLHTALQWSNLYFTYSIPFKLHSYGVKESIILQEDRKKVIRSYDTTNFPKEDKIGELAQVEHNRWMVEKLLLGYRRLTKEERTELDRIIDKNKKIQEYKDSYRHPNIQPYNELDDNAINYNKRMSEKIPDMLKEEK